MTSDSKIRALIEGPIPAELQPAVDEYCRWQLEHVQAEQDRVHVTAPLFHYTSLNALRGIVETESVWCTGYRHMNDPSELSHGVEVVHDVLNELATGADGRVRLFCEAVGDLLVPRNFTGHLDFYTGSFTAQRDDAGQWKKYRDNGRGVAVGFSASMFSIVDAAGLQPNELSFVGPVLYDRAAIFVRHDAAIRAADARAFSHQGLALPVRPLGVLFGNRWHARHAAMASGVAAWGK